MTDTLAASRPRRRGDARGRPRHPRASQALDHRPLARRPPADAERRRPTWLTFNGEIYNYLELRDELRELGRDCRDRVRHRGAARGLREWGVGDARPAQRHVRLRDLGQRGATLLLARDRFGVKPLYYTSAGRAVPVRLGDQGPADRRRCPADAERRACARVPRLRARRPHRRDDVRRRIAGTARQLLAGSPLRGAVTAPALVHPRTGTRGSRTRRPGSAPCSTARSRCALERRSGRRRAVGRHGLVVHPRGRSHAAPGRRRRAIRGTSRCTTRGALGDGDLRLHSEPCGDRAPPAGNPRLLHGTESRFTRGAARRAEEPLRVEPVGERRLPLAPVPVISERSSPTVPHARPARRDRGSSRG